MKKATILTLIAAQAYILFATYQLGKQTADSESKAIENAKIKQTAETVEAETRSEIARNYFKHIGNPTTAAEHCLFTLVIYGEGDECEADAIDPNQDRPTAGQKTRAMLLDDRRNEDGNCFTWDDLEWLLFGDTQE